MTEENLETEEKPSIGARLRARRIELGDISEQTVNETTHIRVEYIRFMEEDRFDSIPLAPVYRLGFLRNYAKYLGLDADALVGEYKKIAKLTGGNTRKPVAGVPFNVEISDGSEYAADAEKAHVQKIILQSPLKVAAWLAGTVVVIVIVILGFTKIASLTDDAGTPVVETAGMPELEVVLTSTASQRVIVNENYTGWDREKQVPMMGKTVFEGQILSGEKRVFKARGKLYVQQEQPGTVSISINGGVSQKGNAKNFIADPSLKQINKN